MDDDEEIDIMNFDDISKISSGQLLSCDYTVHPKWVNENAEGGNFWSDSVPKHENLENNVEVLHSEEVVIEEPEQKSKILDLEWAGEVAHHEDVVFEDDIPASVEEIVTIESDTNLTNTQSTDDGCCNNDYDRNDYYQWDEPAAFETHPPLKNNKYIGPRNERSLLKVKIESLPSVSQHLQINPRSLLKNNFLTETMKPKTKFKQTLTVQQNLFDNRIVAISPSTTKNTEKILSKSQHYNNNDRSPSIKTKKVKFKETVKMKIDNLKVKKPRKSNVALSSNKTTISSSKHNKKLISKFNNNKNTISKSVINFGENITINHTDDKQVEKTFYLPAETVVKLEKCELSDVEVDVEGEIDIEIDNIKEKLLNSSENLLKTQSTSSSYNQPSSSDRKNSLSSSDDDDDLAKKSTTKKRIRKKSQSVNCNKNIEISDELQSKLHDMQEPKCELEMDPDLVTDLEKYIHSEFFDGRLTTKTPEQYLRIRNHILSMWKITNRKLSYVSKTAVRNGLKHGGDVNCISRIHRLLEQIGAINFGFHGRYFEYVRPLDEYMSMFMQTSRTSSSKTNQEINDCELDQLNSKTIIAQPMERRNRIVNKPRNIYSFDKDDDNDNNIDDSNYTIQHLDGVYRPDAPALNSNERVEVKIFSRHIQTELDLVKCLKFSKDNLAPFKVSITLSTLLCLQFHSLSNVNERMGFLGGHRSKSVGRTKLSLTKYKPCRTSEQSGTMCEMCPVSQVEQSANLKAEGFELLGWFHSHPLFPANPSRTDVQTQKEMQLQFSVQNDLPFVGVILSCLNTSFKCMYVMPQDLYSDLNNSTVCVPYELDVDIIKDCTNFHNDIKDVFRGIENDENAFDMEDIILKFKSSSEAVLQQFGYKSSTFFKDIFFKRR